MYFKITNQLKRLCLISFVIIMTLGIFAALEHDMAYADGGHKTMLNVVGVPEDVSVQWYYTTNPDGMNTVWTNEYVLGTALDLRISEYEVTKWTIETTELKKCGPLTGVSLSKTDGTVLQFIKAADKEAGIKSSDFPETNYNNSSQGRYWITSHPDDQTEAYTAVDAYGLQNMLADVVWSRSPKPDANHSTIVTGATVTDDFDHVITLYFNKAEDIPPEVQAVIDAINAIDDPVTLESEDAIATAREEYDKLSEEYKAKIDEDTLKKLTDAERTLKEIKAKPVKEAIAALPKASELTLNDKAAVEAARVAYDALSSEAKEYVDNITTLELAEATIAKLEAQAELAQAKEKLNEALENAEPEDDIDKLAEQVSQAKEDLEKAEQELKNLKDEKAAAKLTISGLKVTSKIKKFTVTWKKNAKADGYQVQYKLKSAKKFSTLKTLAKTKVVSKKRKKGKMYQFKVRTYKTVNGTKVYGKWTKVKTVKCR